MSGRIPEQIIDEIRRRSDILDVVGQHVNLNRKGDRWWGLCPFHSEKTPSFSVSPDIDIFYCFGCQKHGSVFDFVMEIEGLNFPEAVRALAEKAGVEIPDSGEGDEGSGRSSRKALEELHSRVAGTFRWFLLNHEGAAHARDYLESRGISLETAERFKLGWAPSEGEWLYRFLISKKYSPEFLAESGLFSRNSPRWSYFVDRLMFPVMPDEQRVLAFSGRALGDRGPKYINSPETVLYHKSQQLYGYGQARKAIRSEKEVIVCEGNVDVLACSQAGIPNVVAPLGTAFTKDQARILQRQATTLLLLFDGDQAGRAATMKAAIIGEEAGLGIKAVSVPPGRDPADILEKDGPEALKKVLERPINVFEYLLNYLISAQTGRSGEAQEEALKELTPYLESVGSEIRRETYLNQLAEAMKADPAAVYREFRGRKAGYRRSRKAENGGTKASNGELPVDDEIFLLTAVTVKTEYFTTLRKMLAPEKLRNRRALAVYRVLDELSVDNKVPRTDEVLSRLEDEGLKQFILQKAASGIYDERAEDTILDIVGRLNLRGLNEEREELLRVMSRDSGVDPDLTDARLKRYQELDRIIMKLRQGENGRNQV